MAVTEAVQNIESNEVIKPLIYAYTTPYNTESVGWIKIGYTEKDAAERIKGQTHTAGVTTEQLWEYEARFNGGGYFKDHDFVEIQGSNYTIYVDPCLKDLIGSDFKCIHYK